MEKSGQFIKISGSSGGCCLLGKATCVFGAQQAGWELSRHFPPILEEQHTTAMARGHRLPLYSHKNNVDNSEETKDENAVRKIALVDACLDRV